MARVTINMIAERAGVSRGTVDRVLHNRAEVSPDVREHVLAIAKVLGYETPMERDRSENKVIGVVLPGNHWHDDNLEREWMRGVNEARDIVGPIGYEVKLVTCSTDMPDDVVAEMKKLHADGVDGIAMTAINTASVRACIDELAESGVPVVTYNSDLPDTKRACFIGQDLYRSGRVAANLIRGVIGERDEILVIVGNLGFDAHRQRVQGFLDVCTEVGIGSGQILVEQSYNEYYLTYEKVSKAVRENEQLRAVYMANENVAACAEAIAETDRRIMVVGNDLTRVTEKLLKEDRIGFIIEQNVYWQGYQPVILLKKLIERPTFPIPEHSFTDVRIVNSESV